MQSMQNNMQNMQNMWTRFQYAEYAPRSLLMYRYISVCTGMYCYKRNFKVHTGMYWVCTKTKSCIFDTNRGTYSVLKHHLMHVTHTQYRFLQSFDTKKSIFRNISLNMVHTSMYRYILSSYLYVQVDQHVLFRVKGALYSWLGTTTFLSHTPSIT